jgi:outer membrane biosynthesis protein TonB
MWAVLYDDGTSLTTASEPIAHSLAEAERQRGHRVTVRHLDDVADSVPEPEPMSQAERFARPEPISEPEPALPPEPIPAPEPAPVAEPALAPEPGPAPEPTPMPELTQFPGPTQTVEPAQAVEPASVPEPASAAAPPEPAREPEPARAARPARRRRLLVYALAAASIVVAAALADHWDVLPRVGATTSSSPAQVAGSPHRPQLLPPLDQPPVMHFSNAVRARSSANARGG